MKARASSSERRMRKEGLEVHTMRSMRRSRGSSPARRRCSHAPPVYAPSVLWALSTAQSAPARRALSGLSHQEKCAPCAASTSTGTSARGRGSTSPWKVGRVTKMASQGIPFAAAPKSAPGGSSTGSTSASMQADCAEWWASRRISSRPPGLTKASTMASMPAVEPPGTRMDAPAPADFASSRSASAMPACGA